jgi:hypothetical protein
MTGEGGGAGSQGPAAAVPVSRSNKPGRVESLRGLSNGVARRRAEVVTALQTPLAQPGRNEQDA